MLDTKTLNQTITLAIPSTREHGGLNRVLAAAVISPLFRSCLLENPCMAIQAGFQGESFMLTAEETELVSSIHANTLTDLAQRLACVFGNHPQPTPQIPAPFVEFYGR